MTTTHTQPAGCDLDSLQRFNNRSGLMNPEANGLYVRFEDVARAAQAPQGDTRQGAPAGWSMKEFGNGAFSVSRIGGQSATFMPFGPPEEVIKHAFVTALLALPAAHTCTPADERPGFEAHMRQRWPASALEQDSDDTYRNHLIQDAWVIWQARAAQGAGTAPVGAVDPAAWLDRDGHMIKELREFIEGMSVSMDVSTGDHNAGHRYFGIINEVMDDYEDKNGVTLLVYEAHPNFVTPPAPVSTAAATTASASNHNIADRLSLWLSSSLDDHLRQDEYRKHIRAWLEFDGNGVFALDGADAARYRYIATLMDWSDIERMCWSSPAKSAEQFKRDLDKYIDGKLAELPPAHAECIDRIRRAPSRAADGQQGASRAALDVLDDLDTYDPERDMPGVMEVRNKYKDGDYYKVEDVRAALARAPLPAQADGQGDAA